MSLFYEIIPKKKVLLLPLASSILKNEKKKILKLSELISSPQTDKISLKQEKFIMQTIYAKSFIKNKIFVVLYH